MIEFYELPSQEARLQLEELLQLSGLRPDETNELLELGIFEAQQVDGRVVFSTRCLIQARRAARLRRDFELNTAGVALALTYLERIEALEKRLLELECQLLR